MAPERKYRITLWAIIVLSVTNLLLSGSLVGLIGGVIATVMGVGVLRGDYPLSRALGIFLYLMGAGNLIVLLAVLITGAAARTSALVWLGISGLCFGLLGNRLRSRAIQDYLKYAEPPEKKPSRFHFFRGGWRDL